MKKLLFYFCITFPVLGWAQLSIPTAGTPIVIDFDTTVADVNNGQFNGSGFTPTPTPGQLDSDAWEITGLSDGDLFFGGTAISGDFARGASTGSVSTGGIYAFETIPADFCLGFQPTGNDMTSGDVTLRIQNNTGSTVINFDVAYDILVLNDQGRGNDLNFEYSSDNSTYTSIPSLDYSSPAAAAGGWQSIPRSTTITGLNIPNGSFFYVRWNAADNSGSGSRDEFGIDNISITATNGTPTPTVGFEFATRTRAENSGTYLANVEISQAADVVLDVTSADGTAIAGMDYTAIPAGTQVTFTTGGPLTQTVSIPILDDAILEPSENLTITLTINSGTANLANDIQTITITDDDLSCTIAAGDIIFTELMYNPDQVTDGVGEYVELYNTTATAIDILGFTLIDAGGNDHIISQSVVIQPLGTAVLGNNGDPMLNGGYTPDYVYPSGSFEFSLNNGGDEVRLECNSLVLDQVIYDLTNFPDASMAGMPGNAILLSLSAYNATTNDDGANWCFITDVFGDGDTGSPGQINGLCIPISDDQNNTCEDNTDGITTITSSGTATWQNIVDADGRIIASVNDQGNTLGTISTELFITNNAREDSDGTNYMGRSVYITPTSQPTGTDPMIRIYFTDAELQKLILDAAGDADAPVDEFDLVITKVSGVGCTPTFQGTLSNSELITPVISNYGSDFYAEFPVTAFSGFYLHGGALILPVDITTFTAQERQGQVQLQWSTSAELNNSHFEVEHSTTGIQFSTIGLIAGNGTTDTSTDYSFMHRSPTAGDNYYRLKQVDLDGKYAYSEMRLVTISDIDFIVSYSASDQQILITGNKKGEQSQLIDIQGRILAFTTADRFPASDLSRGLYIIKSGENIGKVVVY